MTVGTIKIPRHCDGHVTGITRVVGVDSKSSAPAPSVRARRDRESPHQAGKAEQNDFRSPLLLG